MTELTSVISIILTIVVVGVSLAAFLGTELRELRSQVGELREQVGELRERMARVEGILEGSLFKRPDSDAVRS